MKKVLKNNAKTKEYLNSLPKIYITGCWARWGIMEFPFTGKFYKEVYNDKITYIPLVYVYNDHNGTADQWELKRIDFTTTGIIADWTFNKRIAKSLAEYYNMLDSFNNYKNIDANKYYEGYLEGKNYEKS